MSPFRSDRQRRFIEAKAHDGVPWARKFTADAETMPQPDAMPKKMPTLGQMVGEKLKMRKMHRGF